MPALQRNFVQILVGIAAVLVSIAAVVVIVDRLGERRSERDRAFALAGARRALDTQGERGTLLGVTVEAEDGALVVRQVVPGSPAARAGVRPGDIIEQAAGEDVDDAGSLRAAVAGVRAGRQYDLVVLRDGRERTLRVEREPVFGRALPRSGERDGSRAPGMQPRMQPGGGFGAPGMQPRMQPGGGFGQPGAPGGAPRQPGQFQPGQGPGGMLPPGGPAQGLPGQGMPRPGMPGTAPGAPPQGVPNQPAPAPTALPGS